MTNDEKKTLNNQFLNLCARLGETIVTMEIAHANVIELKKDAISMLSKIREANREEPKP